MTGPQPPYGPPQPAGYEPKPEGFGEAGWFGHDREDPRREDAERHGPEVASVERADPSGLRGLGGPFASDADDSDDVTVRTVASEPSYRPSPEPGRRSTERPAPASGQPLEVTQAISSALEPPSPSAAPAADSPPSDPYRDQTQVVSM